MYANVGTEVREVTVGEFGEGTETAIFYWVEVVDKASGVVYCHERTFPTDNGVDEVPEDCQRLYEAVESSLAMGELTKEHLERSKRWSKGGLTYRHLSYSLGETEEETRHFEWELDHGLRDPINPFPF